MRSQSATTRGADGKLPSEKDSFVSWKIRLREEELVRLRQIAEDIGANRLLPKPTVTALIHKGIQSYIAAWENSLTRHVSPTPDGSNSGQSIRGN